MPASELYRSLIENPTKNVVELQRKIAGRVGFQLHVKTLRNIEYRFLAEQFELDAAMWYGAIKTGPYEKLLTKIFHIFYYAGVLYNQANEGWKDWSENRFGVASLLSHGQRVLLQIPPSGLGGTALWEWLNNPVPIPWRFTGTHGQSRMEPADLIKGRRQYVKEKKGRGQALSGAILGRHYGVNVALGGDGNTNGILA